MKKLCEISIQAGIPIVRSFPRLFNDILNYTNNNVRDAISMYGMTLSDEFKNLNIENPALNDLIAFIDYDNVFDQPPIEKQDRQLFLDMTLNNEPIDNIADKFIDSFTVNGMFGINIDNLRQNGLFNDNDILKIMNMSNVDAIQQLYYKVKESNETFVNVSTPYIISTDSGFGKVNPDLYLGNIYNNYINATNITDVLNMAESIQDDVVINNPSIAATIVNEVQNKQAFVSYETDEDTAQAVKKSTNNIQSILEQTLDTNQNFDPLLSQFEYLMALPIEPYVYDQKDIQNYLKNIEKQAAKIGLNLTNLSESIIDRTYNQVQDFLGATFNFLMDVANKDKRSIPETLANYAVAYDSYFMTQPDYIKSFADKVSADGIFLQLESNQSEEQLFATNSIIKYRDNIYQKINDNKSQSELNNLIYQNPNLLPTSAYSVPIRDINEDIILNDIDNYITEKAKSLVNLVSDMDVLKKLVSYKILAGISLDQQSTVPLNNSYLQSNWIDPEQFVIDFNKEMLKPNSKLSALFYFSNRGLEAKFPIGDYTLQQLQNELTEAMFDKLQQYALLSNNESLQNLKPQYELIETDNADVMRNYYANNMHLLGEVFNPYQIIGTAAIINNIADPFVKIRGELYEQVKPNVYELVQKNDRFMNFNLDKPELSISNPEKYMTSPIIENNIKVITTKIENSEIEFC